MNVDRFIAERARRVRESGIRRIFNLAAALQELQQIVEADENPGARWNWGLARANAWLSDADSAFHYLELEMQSGSALFGLANNPYFTRIHDDPRWHPLIESIEERAAQIRFEPQLPPEILAIQ